MIKCMLIDDEPWALALVEDYVKKIPFLTTVYSTTNPIDAIEQLKSIEVDLLFLDIQMPEISGMQLMKIVGNGSRVILTTAYSEYALEGYEHNVIDYLLKPISFDRFYTAALKARDVIEPKQIRETDVAIVPERAVADATDFIFVKTDKKIIKVFLHDILLIEGLKDYVAIHTTEGKLISLESLRRLEDGLPAGKFLRVHKSYIIAVDKIQSIERNRIFIEKEVIPIGETYREQFFQLIGGKQFG